MHLPVDNRRETYDKGCGASMGSRADNDDRTMQFPHAATAQPEAYERLAHAAPESDENPTVIAASPSQSMLLVADPTEEAPSSPGAQLSPHPADDEPNTMLTQAPEGMLEARQRIPTPRMDLRMYTPSSIGSSSIGPTALTLAPPTPSSTSIPRMRFPLPRFDVPEPGLLNGPQRSRVHPVAWIAVGVLLGAAAMAAVLSLRGNKDASTNAASANVPVESELDKIAPMPSARPKSPSSP